MQNNLTPQQFLNTNRWAEIRFYYFCKKMYAKRRELLDVTDAIEALCNISDIGPLIMRNITVKTLTDYSLVPNKTEVLVVGRENGYSIAEMANLLETSSRNICYMQKNIRKTPDFTVYLRYSTDERIQIKKLLDVIDFFKECIV